MLKCDNCYDQLQHQEDVPYPLAKWTILTDFTEDAQIQVCVPLFELLFAIDFNVKMWFPQLLKSSDMKQQAEMSNAPALDSYDLPTCLFCPMLKQKISFNFLATRLKQITMKEQTTQNDKSGAYQLGSKSMGYRYLASQYTVNKHNKLKNAKNKENCQRRKKFDLL